MQNVNPLNTIYIISKGRPQCRTARTLTEMEYPGDWFIVCGTNDETLPEYYEKWKDKVLVFDWERQVEKTKLLDNFGVQNMPSGASPVRNAVRKISEDKGEIRHWQFDDDYVSFYYCRPDFQKWNRFDGQTLFNKLLELAEYGERCNMVNIGFSTEPEARLEVAKSFSKRVFNAHNLPSDEKRFVEWRGRLNDDLINAMSCYHRGGYEMSVRYMKMIMPATQSESGGLTDIYQQEGTVRKTAYAVLIDPNNVKLDIVRGRYHHRVNWKKIVPKLINEKYAK